MVLLKLIELLSQCLEAGSHGVGKYTYIDTSSVTSERSFWATCYSKYLQPRPRVMFKHQPHSRRLMQYTSLTGIDR